MLFVYSDLAVAKMKREKIMIRFLLLLFHQGNTEKPGKILMVVIKIALDSLWACKAPSIIDVNYRDQGIQKRHLKVRRRLLWMICKREILHPDAVKHWSRLGIWCYASWITQLLYKGFPTLHNLWDVLCKILAAGTNK